MSPPGKRFSMCRPDPSPTIRKPVVRLSRPQTTLTGAQDSHRVALVGVDVRRDEESQLPRDFIMPPRKWRMVGLIP